MYFPEDKTVSVIRAGAVLESSNSTLDVGGACRVREKGKVYHGIVVTYGERTRVQHSIGNLYSLISSSFILVHM